MVKLKANDGREFTVSKEVASQSTLIKNMLEDVGDMEDTEEVPLMNVNGNILEKVLEYATHHKDDPPPPPESDNVPSRIADDISEWDKTFMNVDQETTFEIILAANYLDIKGLLDLGCKTVALMIKGKSVEEIRELFKIVNDFTPEEEEQIRKENEWAAEESTT